MNDFFKLNEYIIKQKVQPFKSAKTIMIINPENNEEIADIKKIVLEKDGFFIAGRHALGIYTPDEKRIATVGEINAVGGTDEETEEKKNRLILGVLDENDEVMGKFFSKNMLGATLFINDPNDERVGELKVGFTGDKIIDVNGNEVLKVGRYTAGVIRESLTKAKSFKLKMLKEVEDNEKILFVTAAILYQIMCSYNVHIW